MALPDDPSLEAYKGVRLIKFDMPLEAKDDIFQLEAREREDAKFRKTLSSKPKIGNTFVSQINYFFHGMKPKRKWGKAKPLVRECIVKGLLNRGHFTIEQKERLYKKIGYIEDANEKARVLFECNDQLSFSLEALEAFSCCDERIMDLFQDVKDAYAIDPRLGPCVKKDAEKLAAAA